MAFRQSTTTMIYSLFFFLVLATPVSGQFIELVNLQCDEEVMASSTCGAGGIFNGEDAFSGSMVCRNTWYGFFTSQKESVCAPKVLNQVIGYEEDTCGCCNGVCPPRCSCVCDAEQDLVRIQKKRYLFGDGFECVSRGMASRKVGDGTNNYSCVSDSECPALAPTASETDTANTTESVEP